MNLAFRLTACFCLSLVLWTAVAEPAHNHDGLAAASGCNLCMATHNVAPAAAAIDPVASLVVLEFVAAAQADVLHHISSPTFGVRGPPLAQLIP